MAEFNIDKLNIEITANATKASNALDKLNAKVNKLQKTLSKAAPTTTKFSKSMESLSKTTKAINVKPLTSLSSTLKTITGQESAINRLTASLGKLSTSAKTATTSLTTSGGGSTSSSGGASGLLGIFGKLGTLALVYYGLKRVGQGLATVTQVAVDATEQLNLFNVSLGQNAEEVGKWVTAYSEATGFDPFFIGENVANFYRIASAMGLATDKAKTLATNFAALGFDISSLINLDTEESFVKLSAGLVGETEPLRRVGVILTENNLAETASRLGIEKSIRTMTESEKIQLRYLALLEQTTVTQGDLARTIEQPANQLKILKDQFIQLGRAIGVLLINFIGPALPYFIAFTHVITDLVKGLGSLLGIPPLEFEGTNTTSNGGGITSELEDIEEAADGASAALKGVLAPFDELNVLTAQTTATSSISGIADSGLIDVDLPEYNNLIDSLDLKWKGLTETIETSLGKFKEFFSGVDTTALSSSLGDLSIALEPFVGAMGEGLSWFVQNVLKPLTEWTVNELLPIAITTLASGFDLLWDALKPIGALLKPLWDNYLKPGIENVGDGIIAGLEGLNTALIEIKDEGALPWVTRKLNELGVDTEDTQEKLEKFGKKVKSIYQKYIEPYLKSWGEDFTTLYNDDLKPFLDDIGTFTDDTVKLFEAMNIDLDVIFGALGFIALNGMSLFVDNFTRGVALFTQELDSFLTISDGIIKIGLGIITGDMSTITEGLVTILEGIVNVFASGLNFVINSFIDGLNAFVRSINPLLTYMGKTELTEIKAVDIRADFTSQYDAETGSSDRTSGGGSGSFGSGGSGSFEYDPSSTYNTNSETNIADDLVTGLDAILNAFLKKQEENFNTNNQDVILQVDGTEIGRASLNGQSTINRQSGGTGVTRPIKALLE